MDEVALDDLIAMLESGYEFEMGDVLRLRAATEQYLAEHDE